MSSLQGVASLLPQPYYGQVEALWAELETDFGLKGVCVTPYPHFTWQIAPAYDLERITRTLEDIASRTAPFEISTAGLGLFNGESPVLYIPLVKTPVLTVLHQQIWQALLPASTNPSPYYSPEQWVPHITLACNDLTAESAGAVITRLVARNFDWQMRVANLFFVAVSTEGESLTPIKVTLRG